MSNSKSELLKCFQSPSIQPESPACYDCRIMDGAATVHFLPTTGVATLNDYAENLFIPYLQMQLQSATRIDIVWDTYLSDSLKESTQEKRGKGVRSKVSGQMKLPGRCIDFLGNSKNKTEFFTFLTDKIVKFTFPPMKLVCHSRTVCFTQWI